MKLKILIINPPRVDGYPVVREERFEHKDIGSVYPPLSLLYIAALLRKNSDFDIKFLDANGFDLTINTVRAEMINFSPDVVILRCGFDTQKQDFEIFRIAKDLGAITVLRNKIISDVPNIRDDILKKEAIDIFINSEPEAVIMDLMVKIYENKKERFVFNKVCAFDPKGSDFKEDFSYLKKVKGISFIEKGQVITTEPEEPVKNLDDLPFPAYDLLPDLNCYHTGVLAPPFALVATSRGCPFSCTFCAYGKSKYRVRSVENVIAEIKWLKEKFKIKSFLFFDDTISLISGRTEEIAKRMIEEKLNDLKWVCCTRANLVNFEMLKLMKQAGMVEIAIGIETGAEEIQKNINKGVSLDSIRQCAKWCHKLGILFYGLVIIGLPGETEETVKESIKFIKEIDPFYTQFCFATPFPNTEIYNYYKKNGFLLTEDWSKYFPLAEEPVIRTEKLTAEDLKKLRRYAYLKLLLRPGYLIRKIKPFDLVWNISGFIKIMGRIIAAIKNKPIR